MIKIFSIITKKALYNEELLRRSILFSLPFILSLSLAFKTYGVNDPDIWWHLSSAKWMMEHKTIPTKEVFSTYGTEKPWLAVSWLFEVFVYKLYQTFGLMGLPLYIAIMTSITTLVLMSALRTLGSGPAETVLMTSIGVIAMAPLLQTPRPWLFSILFFCIEMSALIQIDPKIRNRRLPYLPLLFVFWSNMHIQFIYGLFFFAVRVATLIAPYDTGFNGALSYIRRQIMTHKREVVVFIGCCLSTLITPHPVLLYKMLYSILRNGGSLNIISEMNAIPFRDFSDWAILGLFAFASVSIHKIKGGFLASSLWLATSAFLSFKAYRDIWVITVTAIFLITQARSLALRTNRFLISIKQAGLSVAIIALYAFSATINTNNNRLEDKVKEFFPWYAVQVVRQQGHQGPLFNHFNWGGFLTWYLPEHKVSMYGGSNIMGDNEMEVSMKTWEGSYNWFDNPIFRKANLVIGQKDLALTSLLKLDPDYNLIYEDNVSAVFTRKNTSSPNK